MLSQPRHSGSEICTMETWVFLCSLCFLYFYAVYVCYNYFHFSPVFAITETYQTNNKS